MSFRKIQSRSGTPSGNPSARFSLSLASALLLSTALSACIGGPDGRSKSKGGVSVELQLLPEALAKTAASVEGGAARPIDSIHVRVSAPDMDTARFGFGGASQSVSLVDLPAGSGRKFTVRLLRGGKLLYAGETTVALSTAGKNSVTVNCLPEFSRLTASVHVPADFPKAVAGGELRLWGNGETYSAAAVVNGELRNFRLEEVPGDQDYTASIALWNAAGDTLAKAYKTDLRVPKAQSVALVLPLTLTFTQLALSMTVGDPRATSIVLTLPGGKRAPAAFGEVVFSEVYPIPSVEEGGDNGEWLELFNRTGDTLDVAGCQVVRDAGTSASMLASIPSGTAIAPGRTLLMGKSAATFAQVAIGASALSLTNTSARLAFSCASGAGTLDTMRYNTSLTDTLSARVQTAKVATLKPSRILSRQGSEAWCLSSTNPTAGEYAATPGGLAGGCGE